MKGTWGMQLLLGALSLGGLAAGIFGDTVQWRDRQLKLRPDGRIVDEANSDEAVF